MGVRGDSRLLSDVFKGGATVGFSRPLELGKYDVSAASSFDDFFDFEDV